MKRSIPYSITCPDCGGRGSSGIITAKEGCRTTWTCDTCHGRGQVSGEFVFDTDAQDPLKDIVAHGGH